MYINQSELIEIKIWTQILYEYGDINSEYKKKSFLVL